jgi:hypothetical protein
MLKDKECLTTQLILSNVITLLKAGNEQKNNSTSGCNKCYAHLTHVSNCNVIFTLILISGYGRIFFVNKYRQQGLTLQFRTARYWVFCTKNCRYGNGSAELE